MNWKITRRPIPPYLSIAKTVLVFALLFVLFCNPFRLNAQAVKATEKATSSVKTSTSTLSAGEKAEAILSEFKKSYHIMKAVKVKAGATDNEMKLFESYYRDEILAKDRVTFYKMAKAGKITEDNFPKIADKLVAKYYELFVSYKELSMKYKSNIDDKATETDGAITPGPCVGACDNVDFASGTLAGWQACYAVNSSTSSGPVSVTGQSCSGTLGAVTSAAYDASTSSNQVSITSGAGNDPIAGAWIPVVCPTGTGHSVMIGDGQGTNYGVAILKQTFLVTAANENYIYSYAVVLEDPAHPFYQQPFFNISFYDGSGNIIPGCGDYSVVSQPGLPAGWKTVTDPEGNPCYCKQWSSVYFPLNAYLGQCVTIIVEAADCAQGAHFGYAYFDASCSPGVIASSPVYCGNNVTLTAPSGSSSYSWSGPCIVGSSTGQTVTVGCAGTYTCTLTSAAGASCTVALTSTVTAAAPPTIVVSPTSASSCSGTAVPLVASGGTTYTWSPGTGLSATSGANVNATPATTTTYTVTGTTGGCSNTATAVITVSTTPTVTASGTATLCSGGSTALSATGATSYTWSPAATLSASTGAAVTATPTATTTYTVTGTTGGCTSAPKTVTVTVNTTPTVTATAGSPTICSGSSTTLTGTGATTYSWLPGPLAGSPVTVSPATTTTYTLTGTTTGCTSAPKTVTVTVNTTPTVTIAAAPPTICSGSTSTLTSTGATTYVWAPAGTLSASSGTSVIATPAGTTTYTVTGTTTGCPSAPKTVTVTVNTTPTVTAGAAPPTICSGATSTLTSSGATTYIWSPAGTLSASSGASVIATPTGTTTYTVTGTTAGCTSAPQTVTVNVNATPTLALSAPPTICPGVNATLTAGGATSYTWSPNTSISVTTGSSVIVNPISTITYTVVGTGAGGCNSSGTITVTVAGALTVTATAASPSVCIGGSGTLLTGGGATTYTWSPGTGLSTTMYDTTTAFPSTPTTYTVTGTSGGCTGTATVSIAVNPSPTVSINITSISAAICPGDSLGMQASGATTYAWTPATGLSCTSCANTTAGPGATTTYTLTGTNAAGCTSTATQLVTAYPTPVLSVTPTSATVCSGDTVSLTASGVTSYTWAPGTALNVTTGPTVIANPTTTGTYTVTGTGVGGCKAKDSVVVTVSPTPVITITPPTPAICAGTSTVLTASGASSYTWTPGTGLTSVTGDTTTASPGSTTTYTVTGISAGGCTGSADITVTVNPLPTISVTPPSPSICTGDSAILTAGGALTYVWSPAIWLSADTGSVVTTIPGGTTTYSVTGTDVNGCNSNASVTITVGNITVAATVVKPAVCAGDSTIINATGAATYTWFPSTGLNNTTGSSVVATPTATTTYTLAGSSGTGCADTIQVLVTVNQLPGISVSSSDSSICSKGGSATLIASGGNTYVWSPSTGLNNTTGSAVIATPTTTTFYIVTGTSASGCSSSDTINVNVVAPPVMTVTATGGDTLCTGQSTTLSATGAASYVWSTTAVTSSVTVTPATSGTVYYVIGSNGTCTDTSYVTLYLYPPFNVTMLGDTLCSGSTATISVNATGGGSNYTYVWNQGLGTGPGPKSITAASGGYYVCTVTSLCGQVISDSAQVVAIPKANAFFTESADTIFGGQFVSFANNNSGANSWNWTMGNTTTGPDDSLAYSQYNIPGNYYIMLIANNRFNCADTAYDSVYVTEGIYIPNVFTPNGDGVNDVFHITAGGMQTYSIEIFNRWGEKVFETDSPQIDWDGTSMGGVQESDGTYYYIIRATDYRNKSFNQNGYLQLIR